MSPDLRMAHPPPAAFTRIDVDAWTAPFWDAAARHILVLPSCAACRRFRMPPTPFCPNCRSQSLRWETDIGPAILYSYTLVERHILPEFQTELPYVPAIVEFPQAERVRLITNIVSCRIGDIAVGRSLALHWHDLPGGRALPLFTMAIAGLQKSAG